MHKSIVLCDDISIEQQVDIENFIDEWQSSDEMIQVQTSGSTGTPKKIQLSKTQVRASAKATGTFFNFEPDQTVLLSLSTNYIAGKLMLVRALEHQMRVLVTPVSQNPLLSIGKMNVDFAAFVPYQVEHILEDLATKSSYEKIPAVIIGGGPISSHVESELAELKNQSYATFGMTETITHFALRNMSRKENFYTCLPGISIDQDERGCLIINKNSVSDRLVTNDLIKRIDNRHFQWLGRIDNVVNSAGIKLSPELLESKIAALIEENRFYFIGRESEVFGEELILYIEGERPSNWESVQAQLDLRLSSYERPKAVIFVKKFEETETGKVKRLLL